MGNCINNICSQEELESEIGLSERRGKETNFEDDGLIHEKLGMLEGALKFSNPIEDVDKELCSNILRNAPKRTQTTLDQLCSYLKQKASGETEANKAWIAYQWMGENIVYDIEGKNNGNADCSEEGAFKSGKTVCSGYSGLYSRLAKSLGIEVVNISGYSKGAGFEVGQKFTKTDHEWNAVKISNKWQLIESTWGAGHETDGKFIKEFDPYYFCTPPIEFVEEHLPVEEKWQLLDDDAFSMDKFCKVAQKKGEFFKRGCKKIIPDEAFMNIKNNKQQVIIKYETDDNLRMTANIYYLNKNKNCYEEMPNSALISKFRDLFKIDILFPKSGEYKIEYYCGNQNSDKNTLIAIQKAICPNESPVPLSYPKPYSNDYLMELVEPALDDLVKGTERKFIINCQDNRINELYINANGSYIPMEKNNNGIYSEDNVYITNDIVSISIPKEKNKYSTLFEYSPKIDKSLGKISYPQCFGAPKNKLLSPRMDKLIKGKIYHFKIESKEIEEICVINNSEWINLEKVGNIFEGDITPSGNQLKISYKLPNEQWGTIYVYTVE